MNSHLVTGDLIKTKEAALLLGCSTGTIRNLIKKKVIPAVRMGLKMRAIRIHQEDLQRFVAEQRNQGLETISINYE